MFLQCVAILMHLQLRPDPAALAADGGDDGEGGGEAEGAAGGAGGGGVGEELLDLYIYYAVTGLAQPSASLRAAALSMLALVAGQVLADSDRMCRRGWGADSEGQCRQLLTWGGSAAQC